MNALLERLASNALELTEKIAIVNDNGDQVSYSELWREVNIVSSFIQIKGYRGSHIGLLSENSSDYIAAYYGIWHSKNVVIAFNVELSLEELVTQMKHAEISILFVDQNYKALEKLTERLEKESTTVVVIQEMIERDQVGILETDNVQQEKLQSISSNSSALNQNTDQLAAIIYTSGTTGQAKGVMLSENNLFYNTQAICKALPIDTNDKVLCVLPFYYSYGNSVLHTHIFKGATIVLQNSLMYPAVLIEKLINEKATSFSGVPSTYYLLLSRVKLETYQFPHLRYCTQAGGAMIPEKINLFRRVMDDIDFYVMYGQTEASARITCLPSSDLEVKAGSVGLPLEDIALKILPMQDITELNEDGKNKVGQVAIKGQNVMQGYWRDGKVTQEVIQDGWLKTGDIGYLDDDGYLFLEGRYSDMIKSGAHRISALQIEKVLIEHEAVLEAAVVGLEDEILGEKIAGFVVLADKVEQEQKEIQRSLMKHCNLHIAKYKIPKAFYFLEQLPKTASGKVKKHLLTANN